MVDSIKRLYRTDHIFNWTKEDTLRDIINNEKKYSETSDVNSYVNNWVYSVSPNQDTVLLIKHKELEVRSISKAFNILTVIDLPRSVFKCKEKRIFWNHNGTAFCIFSNENKVCHIYNENYELAFVKNIWDFLDIGIKKLLYHSRQPKITSIFLTGSESQCTLTFLVDLDCLFVSALIDLETQTFQYIGSVKHPDSMFLRLLDSCYSNGTFYLLIHNVSENTVFFDICRIESDFSCLEISHSFEIFTRSSGWFDFFPRKDSFKFHIQLDENSNLCVIVFEDELFVIDCANGKLTAQICGAHILQKMNQIHSGTLLGCFWWDSNTLICNFSGNKYLTMSYPRFEPVLDDNPLFEFQYLHVINRNTFLGELVQRFILRVPMHQKKLDVAHSKVLPFDSTLLASKKEFSIKKALWYLLYPLNLFTDAFLWSFDEETDQRFKYFVIHEHQLQQLRIITPLEKLECLIAEESYLEAQAIAKAFGLDDDIIFKSIWNSVTISENSIDEYLSKITDIDWVLTSCLERKADSVLSYRLLFNHGFAVTESVRSSLVGKQDTATMQIVKCRIKLEDYLYRLDTFELLIDSDSGFMHFEDFKKCDMIVVSKSFAKQAKFHELRQLFERHLTEIEGYELEILKDIPCSIPPNDFKSLLPDFNQTRQILHLKDFDSWESDPNFVKFFSKVSQQCLSESQIRDWYYKRIQDVDRTCGLIDVVSQWYKIAIEKVFHLNGFETKIERFLSLFLDLIEHFPDLATLSLESFCSLKKEDLFIQIFSQASSDNWKSLLVPVAKSWNSTVELDDFVPKVILQSEISLSLVMFQTFSEEGLVSLELKKEMMTKCLETEMDEGQSSLAREIFQDDTEFCNLLEIQQVLIEINFHHSLKDINIRIVDHEFWLSIVEQSLSRFKQLNLKNWEKMFDNICRYSDLSAGILSKEESVLKFLEFSLKYGSKIHTKSRFHHLQISS